jgi:hypothetical protein
VLYRRAVLSAAGLYRLIHWHYYESLPAYLLTAVLVRRLSCGIQAAEISQRQTEQEVLKRL